jgi:hypothetical protein
MVIVLPMKGEHNPDIVRTIDLGVLNRNDERVFFKLDAYDMLDRTYAKAVD